MKKTRFLIILSLLLALLMCCGALAESYTDAPDLFAVIRGKIEEYQDNPPPADEDSIPLSQANELVEAYMNTEKAKEPIPAEDAAALAGYSWFGFLDADASEKQFAPGETLPRLEAAKMLYNNLNSEFPDWEQGTKSWYADYTLEFASTEMGVETPSPDDELTDRDRLEVDRLEVFNYLIRDDMNDGSQEETDLEDVLTRGDALSITYKTSLPVMADHYGEIDWSDTFNTTFLGGMISAAFGNEVPDVFCEFCNSLISPAAAGDHAIAPCGVFDHRICEAGYSEYGHSDGPCGHPRCQSGNHEASACGKEGHYNCIGDHALAPCGDHYTCDEGHQADRHVLASCGQHYKCDLSADHNLGPCGRHYACDGGSHYEAACGREEHFACDGDDHVTLEACGLHALCYEGPHFLAGCGHYVCTADNHSASECGHYFCEPGFSKEGHAAAPCGVSGHYLCSGDHTTAPCGHLACADGNHAAAPCGTSGHYLCDGGSHGVAPCGDHYACDGKDHGIGDCGIEGHFACEGAHAHELMPCGEWSCQVENPNSSFHRTKLGCGHYACVPNALTGSHSGFDCYGVTHYRCDGKNHSMCACGAMLCRDDYSSSEHAPCPGGCGVRICEYAYVEYPQSHRQCSGCGEYVCNPAYDESEHHRCAACLALLCDPDVDPDDHIHCAGCKRYVCRPNDHYADHDHRFMNGKWLCLDYPDEEEPEPEPEPEKPAKHECPRDGSVCSACGMCNACDEDNGYYCRGGCGHACPKDGINHDVCLRCFKCIGIGSHGEGNCEPPSYD